MTEVVAESEWDEEARAEALALVEAEDLICNLCGMPREICSDPSHLWYPQRSVCYATAASEQARWRRRERIRKRYSGRDPERTMAAPFLPDDGEWIWVSPDDLTPDDDFL